MNLLLLLLFGSFLLGSRYARRPDSGARWTLVAVSFIVAVGYLSRRFI